MSLPAALSHPGPHVLEQGPWERPGCLACSVWLPAGCRMRSCGMSCPRGALEGRTERWDGAAHSGGCRRMWLGCTGRGPGGLGVLGSRHGPRAHSAHRALTLLPDSPQEVMGSQRPAFCSPRSGDALRPRPLPAQAPSSGQRALSGPPGEPGALSPAAPRGSGEHGLQRDEALQCPQLRQ